MLVETIVVGPIQTNCYLAYDETTREGFLVDPGADADKILEAIRRLQINVRTIILTHSHFDHIIALSKVAAETGAQVAIHESEAEELAGTDNSAARALGLQALRIEPYRADLLLKDGDTLSVAGEQLTILHTPGHTLGSICLDTGKILFSGDTLFEDGCGRCDLPGGDQEKMLSSLHRLHDLTGDRIVYPGHGPSTTLDRERQVNGAMLFSLRRAW